jgi:hypothetical protein
MGEHSSSFAGESRSGIGNVAKSVGNHPSDIPKVLCGPRLVIQAALYVTSEELLPSSFFYFRFHMLPAKQRNKKAASSSSCYDRTQ